MTRSRRRIGLGFVLGTMLIAGGAAGHVWQAAAVDPPATPETGDAAYVPPTVTEPPLPALPPRPELDRARYPACRESYQQSPTPLGRAVAINACMGQIDDYYRDVMLAYRQTMIGYQGQLSSLYTDRVSGDRRYAATTRIAFYGRMMAEHSASDPEGANLAAYRGMDAQYQTDRAYLQDRYCFNTGCNGYPVPQPVVAQPAVKKAEIGKDTPKDIADKKCKRARKRGGVLGGLIGGAAGSAAGLNGVGTALAGAFGGLVVGEIACQLDEKEQKVAAQATVDVTKQEAVGATASWQSPTREGVTGSSTITALNTEPNGSKCLSITDIAIIEGEETRVAKRMCRKKAGEPYTVMA